MERAPTCPPLDMKHFGVVSLLKLARNDRPLSKNSLHRERRRVGTDADRRLAAVEPDDSDSDDELEHTDEGRAAFQRSKARSVAKNAG